MRTPSGVTHSIDSVIKLTSSRLKVLRYSFDIDGRLQPSPYRGISFSRITGSSTWLRIQRRIGASPARLTALISQAGPAT
ncbi:Uncharacterised protein [Mycobacteroides abscessus subsp. abscessus]|nr:Uncharacterised protein [Mycobacteroides abscessus subsp. abscessus]